MKEKYYDSTSSLILGMLLIILSIILFVGKNRVYRSMVDIVVLVLFIRAFLDMVRFFFRKETKGKKNTVYISCLFHLGVCLTFMVIPNLFYGVVPVLFSIYLVAIGFTQFVMCFIEVRNGEFIRVSRFLLGIIYLGIAIPIMRSPVIRLDTFVTCFAIYTLLLGIYYVYDFMVQILPVRTKNKFKRRIRITLPKIVEALIPYSVMVEINRNLEVQKSTSYSFEKDHRKSDLDILIHTSNRGFNRMGHIDIYFEGQVISYGNYDEGSRIFHDTFGDGVLFIARDKGDYINFCIDNSKKTVFDFGIVLTNRQKNRIRKRIGELLENTVDWNYRDDKKYNGGKSYAAKLYKKTKAKFYKFKKGKYRTYFVLGTNCCFLADDIIGKSGMDILSINGIITPGTYYDYLNRELNLRKSNVISKEVYNFNHRAK